MSAWIVSRAHIDVLVQALTAEAGLAGFTPRNDSQAAQEGSPHVRIVADEIGRELWRENLKSVAYRYPNDEDGGRPGPVDFKDSDVETYTYRKPSVAIPDGGIRAAAGCYAYQSCEHPGWNASRARKWADTLVARHDTADSDRYPWGYDEDDVHGPAVDAY